MKGQNAWNQPRQNNHFSDLQRPSYSVYVRVMFTTLFLDLNSYFASCEEQMRPETRGKPLAVAPMDVLTTCVIAANYEAKAYGVKTGVMVGDAVKMCPCLKVVVARPEIYVEFHHKILAAIDTCVPVAAVHSIDEVSCSLLSREQHPTYAVDLAHRIKRAILNVGCCLRCSIGLATNTVLAKVATDMMKPDGLVCIPKSELPEYLFKLKLIDLPGIGPRMERRLFMRGIQTIQQLCALSPQQLQAAWGSVWGARWWYVLRGEEIPMPVSRRKSLGHQHVLPPQFRNEAGARAVMIRLIDRAATRLRHEGLSAAAILFWVKCREGHDWIRQFGLLDGRDTLEMTKVFGEAWAAGPPYRPIIAGVTLLGLLPFEGLTGSLFVEDRRRTALNLALDRLNLKYGSGTVHPASMMGAVDAAPMRIAFKTIPDLDLI
jgi:DNA polymerase-4